MVCWIPFCILFTLQCTDAFLYLYALQAGGRCSPQPSRPLPSSNATTGGQVDFAGFNNLSQEVHAYRANRLVCDAADRAMQVHGGIGYSRHEPFER